LEKYNRLYNISYQVGLTDPGLPSDSEIINDHGSLDFLSVIQSTDSV